MANQTYHPTPGPIALFGSGETSPSGQRIFEFLFKTLSASPLVRILETPAGFELNSEKVAGNVAEFIQDHLQNYKPRIKLIPARKKGTDFSPDDPDIARPILESDLIFMGPGSPTYAVRQLEKSLAWEYLITRHRMGAALALSSATAIAVSSYALPVYEIYKVGQDIHWQPGLDLFSPFQLSLVFIPHWNNTDGGIDLDTSRCFMGRIRFDALLSLLPSNQVVIGIDEHTGLIIDFQTACTHVIGSGKVTILSEGSERIFPSGSTVNLSELGDYKLPDPRTGISPDSWNTALKIQQEAIDRKIPPKEIVELAEEREQARKEKAWQAADNLRIRIEEKGWTVQDSVDGFILEKILN
ncbi:MAG: hypothetical protein K8R16_11835 [Anaerolineales bacterium]|nr:hypothetical protein [Anaerolineales bacterium]